MQSLILEANLAGLGAHTSEEETGRGQSALGRRHELQEEVRHGWV